MSTRVFKNKKIVEQLFAGAMVFVLLMSPLVPAETVAAASNFNKQINYQGKLTDSSGTAVADGSYNMEFKLYTTSSGGSPIWTETRTGANKVSVTSALFSVLLGEVASLASIDFNQDLYLSVNIGGTGTPSWDGEMTPRKHFGAVPAAFEADKLDGVDSTQFVRTDATSTIATSSPDTVITIRQSSTGNILDLYSGNTSVLAALSSGNIGVGTSSPYAKLSVVGEIVGAFFTGTTTATSSFGGGLQANALNVLSTTATSTFANGINLSGGCFAVSGTCVGGGSSQWTTSGSTIYYNTGNVGIGTSTPPGLLTLYSSSTSGNLLAVYATSTASSSQEWNLSTSSVAIGGYGDITIRGQAVNPRFLASEQGTTPGTTLNRISSVFVQGNYAYVTNAFQDSLAVIDISNPADPVFVAEERGTTPGTTLDNANAVFVSGNYAYVANQTRDSLAVIDVSNPTDPVFVSEERGPTPGTSLDGAASVFVAGNYAYVANSTRDSLAVIDISNPTDPVFVAEEQGTTPGTTLDNASSVFVQGNYAYVANQNHDSLAVIDISNPSDPIFVAEEQGTTPGTTLDGADSVFVSGNYAYVANFNRDSLAVIDISNPADPVFVSEEQGTTPGTTLNGAKSVFVSGNYAYISNYLRESLAVIDISNPADPVFVAEELGTTPGSSLGGSTGVYVSGNYAYVAARLNDALVTIDVSGSTISNFAAGTGKIDNLQVMSNAQFDNSAIVRGGLTVGRDALVSGGLIVTGNSSSTLQSSVHTSFSVLTGRTAFGTSSPYAKLSIWDDGTAGATAFNIVNSASSTLFSVLGNGNVGIGTSSPYAKLSVAGTIVGQNFVGTSTATSTFGGAITVAAGQGTSTFAGGLSATYLNLTGSSATSTAANGINITGGCFAISGTCVGGSASSILSFAYDNTLAFDETKFATPWYESTTAAGDSLYGIIIPKSGVIKNFYVDIPYYGFSTIDGSVVFTVRKNNVNTSLQVTIPQGGAAGSDTSNSFSVSAGDRITVYIDATAGNSGSLSASFMSMSYETGATSNTLTGAGTANRAAFWTNGTDLGADDSFVWDNTNKRLGIGTTSPYAKLSVVGEAVAANFTATSTTATSSFTSLLASRDVRFSALTNCDTIDTDTNGFLKCGTDSTGGGSAPSDWVQQTNYAASALTPSTTIPIWAQSAIYASSTLIVQGNTSLANATATSLAATTLGVGSDYITDITGTGIIVSGGALQASLGTSVDLASEVGATILPIANGGTNNSSAYTSGSVIFSDGTKLTQNNANFFWDNTNARLGIGTSSPYAKLSVAGTIVGQNFIATSTTATSSIAGVLSVGSTSPSANSLFAVGTSTPLFIIDKNTGMVGIGTTTPTEQFSVANRIYVGGTGTSTVENNFAIRGVLKVGTSSTYIQGQATSTFGGGIDITGGGCFAISGTCLSTSGPSQWVTSGSDIYYSTGNVGIGTTSPYAKLSVVGTVVAANFVSTTTATSTFGGPISSGSSDGLLVLSGATTTGDIWINPYGGRVKIGTNGAFFSTVQTVLGGSVDILDSGVIGGLRINNLERITRAGYFTPPVGSETAPSYIFNANADTGFYQPTGDDIAVTQTGVERVRFQSTGNVGIGTTSPYAKLSVAGTIVGQNFVGTSTATSTFGGAITVAAGQGTSTFAGNVGITGNLLNSGYAAFNGATLTPIVGLAVTASDPWNVNSYTQAVKGKTLAGSYGVLGLDDQDVEFIGCTFGLCGQAGVYGYGVSPGGAAPAAYGVYGKTDYSSGYGLYGYAPGVTGTGLYANGGKYGVYAEGTVNYFSGKVGIGTTTPYAALSVAGDVVAASFTATTSTATSTFMGSFAVGTSTAPGWALFHVGTSSASSTLFEVNKISGQVAIGTTTNSSLNWKLTVAGGVCITAGNKCAAGVADRPGALVVDTAGSIPADDVGDVFDVAELYLSSELVDAGDILAIDVGATTTGMLKRGSVGSTLIGIVSTAPALAVNGSNVMIGPARQSAPTSRPLVALSGRVPVKVNMEGGVIRKGDRIAISSVAGVGKKRTSSQEQSVGIALEDWDNIGEKDNKVMVFVSLGQPTLGVVGGDVLATSSQSFWQIAGTGPLHFSVALDLENMPIANVKSITGASGAWSIDENGRLVAKEIEADQVGTKLLCLEDVCITKQQLQSLLNAQGLSATIRSTVSTPSVIGTQSGTGTAPESTPTTTADTTTSTTPTETISTTPPADPAPITSTEPVPATDTSLSSLTDTSSAPTTP